MIASRALSLVAALIALTSAACGGTSSETPWPVEPVNADLPPEGESRSRALVDEEGPKPVGSATPVATPRKAPSTKPKP